MDTSTPKQPESKRKGDSSSEKRNKRYKVGRACYSCRVKKIKCDGLQPCMQCKARRLPCTFSADGVMDDDDISVNETSAINEASAPTQPARCSVDTQQEAQSSMNTHQQLLENTITTLDRLCTTWEGVWQIDEKQLLDNPSCANYSLSLAAPAPISYNQRLMPSKKIQKQLIDQYYQNKYPLFHTIPQDLFLEQFEHPDSSISPLLLFAMFAASTNDNKADAYFDQTKEILDSVLDIPCLSTVVALCLMSLYEPKHSADHPSRPLLYSAMAFRMCYQLDYGQQQTESAPGHVQELYKRVIWSCYCLDKMTSIYLGDPWMIRLQDITVDLPRCYWPNEDQEQMECFVAFIKLMQMAEQSLKPGRFLDHFAHMDESHARGLDNDLIRWLQALPLHLHWTPLPSTHSTTVPSSCPRNAWITHLHLFYNMIQQRLLLSFASPSSDHLLHMRCLSVADNLTQIVHHLSTQSNYILSFVLVGTATRMMTRVYLLNCGNRDRSMAIHAQTMLKCGLQSLSTLLQQEQRSIPGMDLFLSRVNGALLHTTTASDKQSAAGSDPPLHTSMFLPSSDQTATDILTQAFRTSPSTSSSSSTPLWHSSQSNTNITDQLYQPSPPSSLSPSSQQQHFQVSTDPFDFLDSPSLDQLWNQRMAPSSVDALLYKSRFSMDDHPYNPTNGGLLMSHAKLNDPLLLSHWTMRHSKETNTKPADLPNESSALESNHLFWPLAQPPPPTVEKKPLPVRGQQYMNIGLGVYASAHQHHNDVLRQRMP